ncbi:MAG: hypothetical protein ACYC4L_06540 [Chloroflexota bacterium]
MVLQSYTAVVERSQPLTGEFATEPYEAGWAREALLFVRYHEETEGSPTVRARVQISPDGIQWADEGTALPTMDHPGVYFAKVSHFGNWLRLAGQVEPAGAECMALVYVTLKE